MTEPVMNDQEGDEDILRIEKKLFQGGDKLTIIFAGFITISFIYILFNILFFRTESMLVAFGLIIALIFSTPAFVFELLKIYPEEIVMKQSSIELYVNGRFKRAIQYSPTVLVGIFHKRKISHPTFGPLAALLVCENKKCIVCGKDAGWDIEDVRRMWKPFLMKTREYNMRIDPTMQRLIDKMEENAIETYFIDMPK